MTISHKYNVIQIFFNEDIGHVYIYPNQTRAVSNYSR